MLCTVSIPNTLKIHLLFEWNEIENCDTLKKKNKVTV